MFDKELKAFRESIEKQLCDFFGKDMTVSRAVDLEAWFKNKYSEKYNLDTVEFNEVELGFRRDLARYRILQYFLNILQKLNELEKVIHGGLNDNSEVRSN